MTRTAKQITGAPTDATELGGTVVECRVFGSSWGVLTVDVGAIGAVKVVGHALGVRVGDTVNAVGAWSEHPKFGRQFRARMISARPPESQDGIVLWLGAQVAGIGPARARKIAETYGPDLWRVIEAEPEKLAEIPGVSVAMARELATAAASQTDTRDAVIQLRGWGLTPGQVDRVVAQWGSASQAAAAVRANPYTLIETVAGFGFARSDQVARKIGIGAESPERLRAGILHTLQEARGEGHCYLSGRGLQCSAAKLLGVPEGVIAGALRDLIAQGTIVHDGWRVYLPSLFAAEMALAARVREFLADQTRRPLPRIELRSGGIVLDDTQIRAVELACTAPIGVITGGPGRGKTTCLRAAIEALEAVGATVALCAPTGKAARRLSEATGRQASTIHRLIGFGPMGSQRGAATPLEADVVICDEASMIDVELGAALAGAVRPGARLVLIGDADQLPPVGPGRVLGDLIGSGAVPVARLELLHRSASGSWVHEHAPDLLAGKLPELVATHDFRWVEVEDAADVLDRVAELVAPVGLLCDFQDGAACQVLIPQKPGAAGVDAANALLQHVLNPLPGESEPAAPERATLRVGDPVIVTKNDYDRGVFNGEIGEVKETAAGFVLVKFQDRESLVKYDKGEAYERLRLAYALTVHKTQGSEFPVVVVVCHSTHSFVLTRQLLYTAVTRARRGVVIVGDRAGLKNALRARKPSTRNTELASRIATREQLIQVGT